LAIFAAILDRNERRSSRVMAQEAEGAGGRLDMIDYRKRADECYERAAQGGRPEDWAHFSEMAQTWEKLADVHD
jgi:hypothetical protein